MNEEEFLLLKSIALSLERIADSLEKNAHNEVDDKVDVAVESSDDTNENGTIHIYRPVCIKSTERIHQLEIVHTTNLKELSFNIYPASKVINGESGYKISYSKDARLSGVYINRDSD